MTAAGQIIGTAAGDPASLVWTRLVLALIPFALYAESYGFGLLELDDQLYYLHFAALHGGSWRGLVDLWSATALSDYAPISQLTLWLDLAIGGSSSWWFARVHELAWLGVGTLGVHALMLRLGQSRGMALAVSLVYAAHPVCAQSALWLAERKNLVSLALSLWCVERYIATVRDGGGWRTATAAWALGAAAMLAKPHAVAVPMMLAAYELVLGSGPYRARALRLLWPAALAIAFVACSLLMVRTDLHRAPLGGSPLASVLLDGGILLRYLVHTILPTDLTIYYAVREDPPVLASLGWWLLLGVIIALTLLPRGTRRMIAFAWLFSLAALAPALNLVPQMAAMTDHYQQWALPSLLLIGCLLVEGGLARLGGSAARRIPSLALLGAVLFAGSLALARVPEFSSKARLAAAAVRKQPDSAINWSLHAYCLARDTPVTGRDAAGAAAVRAFACADADRIFGEERLLSLIEAAVLLHRRGQLEEEASLIVTQSAQLQGGAGGERAAMAGAQIDLRTGHADRAVALLEPYFSGVLAQAAAELRRHCRDGSHLPDDVPPLITGGGVLTRDLIVSEQQDMFSQTLQWTLAIAHLDNHEPEKAFDVAAVLVNRFPQGGAGRSALAMAYRQLGLADAAARLLAKPVP